MCIPPKTDIKTLRQALGLTQKQFAERLGYHPNTIAQLERGELPMTKRLTKALAHLRKERIMQHFHADNTEGYTQGQLDALNAELDAVLDELEPDSDAYWQAVKMMQDNVAKR